MNQTIFDVVATIEKHRFDILFYSSDQKWHISRYAGEGSITSENITDGVRKFCENNKLELVQNAGNESV